jgi:transcriptional regulator GlxA family with amidase domain
VYVDAADSLGPPSGFDFLAGVVATLRSADQPPTAPQFAMSSFFRLGSAPLRRRAGGGGSAMDARVRAALETVARELEKPQLVKHLAARLRLSPSRFEHIFKRHTGEGFKAFLRAVRMARAKDLLQDATLRIKEVAAAVGYADASDFTRDFRKQYGESPSQSRGCAPQQGRAARTEGPRRGVRSRLAGPPSHRQRMPQA